MILTFDTNQERTVGDHARAVEDASSTLDGQEGRGARRGDDREVGEERARARPEGRWASTSARPRSSRSRAPTRPRPPSQLASFTERWKTEGVDTVFLSGLQVSAQQFVPRLVKAHAGRAAHRRQQHGRARTARTCRRRATRPNPYEGIIATAGVSAKRLRPERQLEVLRGDLREGVPQDRARPGEPSMPGPRGHTLDVIGFDHRRVHRAHDVRTTSASRSASTSTTTTGSTP